jgi:FkbM family methyltransferase
MVTTQIEFYSQQQTQQDQWVIQKTHSQQGGFFIEIGGYDGKRHSNTLCLEQFFDWHGILVEPNPEQYQKLVHNRPNMEWADVAIGPEEGLKEFVVGEHEAGTFSGLVDYMGPDWLHEHELRHHPKIQVPTITLAQLFDRYRVPTVVDYLSLDVEGAEYVILEAFLKECTFPAIRFMTVEFREKRKLDPIVKLLSPYFHLDQVQAWDAFFVNKVLA